ncbi:MAG TPA: NADPH-dependent assimilatory sulfite reductase hemoprotein subunit [Stellaceae bacterium]|nr:NADPH-dependent assimilatory sulfite reductase hemoprotein subunit [Stellaceae bacterium]
MTIAGQVSKVEVLKKESRALRGGLAEGLADGRPAFDEDGYNLLKFHGIYQGYDRDSATERKQSGLDKIHQLMVRTRLPGGRLSAAQYLALDAVADRYANGTLRITTRQTIQFHGVVKAELKQTIAALNRALVTTLAACGDVVRNVTTVPAPIRDAVHARLDEDARRLSQHLLPATRAYHEIWLDGEQVAGVQEDRPEEDALYGTTYLPRKFKIGLAIPEDNSVDVLTNDLGIVALFEDGVLQGYNFALGGGLGMTHNKPKTFPRLATPVAFVAPDDLLDAAAAVVRLHRDHGDRGNRKHARLKYLIAERGEEWAKAQLEAYLGKTLEYPREVPRFEVVDHLGWHEQGDGLLYLGLPVASGRIADRPGESLHTALREIVSRFGCDPILLPSQDILLSNIAPENRAAIDEALRGHGVIAVGDVTPVRRWSLACPALPTCGLALTEAERIQTPLIDAVEERLARHGLIDERLSIRITGCPNGCARPYAGDVGLVGRMPGFFALYVGGDFAGTRLSFNLVDKLAENAVPDTLDVLFGLFADSREAGEGFGDFCHRLGRGALLSALAQSARKAS